MEENKGMKEFLKAYTEEHKWLQNLTKEKRHNNIYAT